MFMAYGLAHKGKVTSDATFSSDDPPKSYNNLSTHTRISSNASEARSVHGAEWDPSTDDIDWSMVMRTGQGKSMGGTSLVMAPSSPALFPPSPRSKQRP